MAKVSFGIGHLRDCLRELGEGNPETLLPGLLARKRKGASSLLSQSLVARFCFSFFGRMLAGLNGAGFGQVPWIQTLSHLRPIPGSFLVS